MNMSGTMIFKRRRITASVSPSASLRTYFDMESEAMWVSFLVPEYVEASKGDPEFDRRAQNAENKLKRDLAKVGAFATSQDIELDIPPEDGDKICTAVYFFESGKMPSSKELLKAGILNVEDPEHLSGEEEDD